MNGWGVGRNGFAHPKTQLRMEVVDASDTMSQLAQEKDSRIYR